MPTSLPVLMYHHVGPARPGTLPGLTVPPDRFERQLRWLTRRRNAVALDDVIGWAREERSLPPRPVLLTFDDAYADLSQTAFPLLEAAGLPATVFAVSSLVGERNNWDPREAGQGHLLLDAEGMRRWSGRGIEFGAHTRTHPDLSKLDSVALEAEIAGSRADLENLLDAPVRAFAYPFKPPDAASREVAARNFDLAFTVAPGRNSVGTDPHALRRAMVFSSDGGWTLAQKMLLGRAPLQLARQELGEARRRLARARS